MEIPTAPGSGLGEAGATRTGPEDAGVTGARPQITSAVLVATGDPAVGQAVQRMLAPAGHEVVRSESVDPSRWSTDRFQLVLVDATPAGPEAAGAVRRHLARSTVPVIAFSATQQLDGAIEALHAGAQDMVSMAATPQEVLARVANVIRRHGGGGGRAPAVVLTGGPVVIDVTHRRATVSGRPVMLTALEYQLLSFFLMHPDEPVTRERLLREVWGYTVGGTATVTVHVRRLREKIEDDPADPMLVRTIWGVGYRFSPMGP